MRKTVQGSCVLVLSVALLLLHHAAAQKYMVTEEKHPDCNNQKLTMLPLSAVSRGVLDAPCTGYLRFNSRRLCTGDTAPFVFPTTEVAQRACYTMGTNMYRPEDYDPMVHEEIMLFICDIYTEFGVGYPDASDPNDIEDVTRVIGIPVVGKKCTGPQSSMTDFCFKGCYNSQFSSDTEAACVLTAPAPPNPFWATIGIDVDECVLGVLTGCTSPFPDSCMRRRPCGDNTFCTNVRNGTGGWLCDCMEGYESDDPYDDDCEDIDECEDDDELCGDESHGQCINTPGSYVCACRRPELYDDGKCKDSECPEPPELDYATVTSTDPNPLGDPPQFEQKVTYTCNPGYLVETFEIKCTASGQWNPYPTPICYPVTCKDPGDILNAQRSGSSWNYQDEVTYTCMNGYMAMQQNSGINGFKITCNGDGTWEEGSTCEDVDECMEEPGICGVFDYCKNTIGSYICIDGSIPSLNLCELLVKLGLCINGNCFMEGGFATCSCFPGYDGMACDRPMDSTALIIAIVGMVLSVVVLVLVLIVCCRPLCLTPPPRRDGYSKYPKSSSMQTVYQAYAPRASPPMHLMYPAVKEVY